MFMLPGHGTTAVNTYDRETYGAEKVFPDAAACGFVDPQFYPVDPDIGRFDYYFGQAAPIDQKPGTTGALDALADAMVRPPQDAKENATNPPVFTYFGQFADHDLTANTDRESGISIIDVPQITPLDRDRVRAQVQNLRAGALNLDSVYGGGPLVGPFAQKLQDALRFHGDAARLWVGTVSDAGFGNVRPPHDIGRDVLRLRDLLRRGLVSEDELRALPADLRDLFVNPDGSIRVQRAILGDMRNDENLAVSQFHLAWVRLHNTIVIEARDHPERYPDAPVNDRDGLFQWARRMTTWHYQWLLLHVFLPQLCDPDTLDDIRRHGPRLYDRFFARNTPTRPDLMPMPLEFSVAAFRFGHSMARDAYDWSDRFGRPEEDALLPRAGFAELFRFTGGASSPMPLPGGGNAPSLPAHWPIDWQRFVEGPKSATPDRATRRIDSNLALPVNDLVNDDPSEHGVLRHLARRNLRRGYLWPPKRPRLSGRVGG
ncbi:peroxidase family protein [Sulfitobacter pacificus]|uniref:peroxidase family protein n=1 Tax=Sulfitobacter pacificus TaxID=1499314 RepID=UPI003614FAB7